MLAFVVPLLFSSAYGRNERELGRVLWNWGALFEHILINSDPAALQHRTEIGQWIAL